MAEQITIKIPDSDAPGFIEEQIAIAEFRKSIAEVDDKTFWEKFSELALRYIVEPSDEEAKRQVVKHLSRAQVNRILDYLQGKFEDAPLVPLSKSPSSTTG